MEFLKNVGAGLFALLIVALTLLLVGFVLMLVLVFNEWLFNNHQESWLTVWYMIWGTVVLITLMAVGRKIRA